MPWWAVADDGREWEAQTAAEAVMELADRNLDGGIDVEDEVEGRRGYYRRTGRALIPLELPQPDDDEYWDAVEEDENAVDTADA